MMHNLRLATELAAPPIEIYTTYLDPELHANVIGGAVSIAAREGAAFHAFEGELSGKILHLIPGKRIVQTWRSNMFTKSDPDSILVITLWPRGRRSTLLDLQQIDVPEQDYAGVCHGWELYYFAPWREYLAAQAAAKRAEKRGKKPVA